LTLSLENLNGTLNPLIDVLCCSVSCMVLSKMVHSRVFFLFSFFKCEWLPATGAHMHRPGLTQSDLQCVILVLGRSSPSQFSSVAYFSSPENFFYILFLLQDWLFPSSPGKVPTLSLRSSILQSSASLGRASYFLFRLFLFLSWPICNILLPWCVCMYISGVNYTMKTQCMIWFH
jgi:hypothetical protein